MRSDSSSRRPKEPSIRLKLSAKVRRLLVTLPVVASTVINVLLPCLALGITASGVVKATRRTSLLELC